MDTGQPASLCGRLLAAIGAIPIVDTHEHLEEEGNTSRLERAGWTLLLHYVQCDLVAAGVDGLALQRATAPGTAPEERWDALAPWWPAVSQGAYMRVLNRGLAALHGVPSLSRGNVAEVEARMRRTYATGAYRKALKDLANIEVSLVDPLEPDPRDQGPLAHRGLACDPTYFLCDYHERVTEDLANSHQRLARRLGREVRDLAAWKGALADDLARVAAWAPAIKCTLGYSRALDFEPVTEADAARLAARTIAGQPLAEAERKALQDHFVDYLADLGAEHGLPLMFHTGLHAGGGNFLERTRLEPFTGLVRRHPRTRFDLFHIAYPNDRDAIVLAKYYGNVSLDFCWAWAFAPRDAEATLHACLDLLPVDKVCAFGGDYFHLEGALGHSLVAREGIARVLAERVERGWLTEEGALAVALTILHDGPARLFRTAEKLAAVRAARAALV
jgi:hypothetical protein